MKVVSLSILTVLVLRLLLPSLSGSESPGTVARLCQTVKERKQLIVDADQPEVIWSDGAMFEVATKFPPGLQELIAAPSNRRDLKPTIARFEREQKADWKDATVSRSPQGEAFRMVKSADGSVSVSVSSAYIDYLKERYPSARIRVKGELQPVLFMVGQTIRGAVMPMRGPAK